MERSCSRLLHMNLCIRLADGSAKVFLSVLLSTKLTWLCYNITWFCNVSIFGTVMSVDSCATADCDGEIFNLG